MSARSKRAPGSRIVGYRFDGREVTLAAELLLWRGIASGVLTNGDCHSLTIWFDGAPGPAIRALRDQINAQLDVPEIPLGVRRQQLVAQCTRARRLAEKRTA